MSRDKREQDAEVKTLIKQCEEVVSQLYAILTKID